VAKTIAMDDPEELLDLVDDNDKVIGTVARREIASKMLDLPGNVRASDCFIVDSRGRLFVPRRSPDKKRLPNALDFSAGEHVASGETYLQAMVRGFKEELGMTIQPSDLEHIGTLNLRSAGLIPYIDAIFIYHSDATPDYNKDDFASHEWLTPDELRRKIRAGEPAKVNILPALDLYEQAKSKG